MKRIRRTMPALALVVVVLLQLACGPMDTVIATCDNAPLIVANLNIPQDEKDRLSHGFTSEADVLRHYRAADKSTPEKKRAAQAVAVADTGVIIARDFAPVSDPQVQVWMDSIVAFVRGVLGMTSGGTARMAAAAPRDVNISDADAKAFKKLVEQEHP